MTCSPARLAANRLNAQKSTGPRTEAGKLASRGNALKHGLTGEGVVLPDEDVAEVDRRFAEFEAELRPSGGVGRFLARRAAMLSVRLDRSARQEAKATASAMRRAVGEFDHKRLAEAEHALGWIGAEPATHARVLRSMPEGVDLVVARLLRLREELDENGAARWSWHDAQLLANLMGRRYLDQPACRVRTLAEAIGGDFSLLLPGEGEGEPDRRVWARDRLVDLIDDEVAALRAHRETLDPEAIRQDREEAPTRAIFDPSKEATLARRYEAAAERNLYRALRKVRELESAPAAEVPAMPPAPEALDPDDDHEPDAPEEPVGSFFPGDDRDAPAPASPAPGGPGSLPPGPAGAGPGPG